MFMYWTDALERSSQSHPCEQACFPLRGREMSRLLALGKGDDAAQALASHSRRDRGNFVEQTLGAREALWCLVSPR